MTMTLPYRTGRTEDEECALRVLIVDDEPLAREGIKLMLSGDSQVMEARNGREAVAKIRDEKPDLVVLDVQMPRMDGFRRGGSSGRGQDAGRDLCNGPRPIRDSRVRNQRSRLSAETGDGRALPNCVRTSQEPAPDGAGG